MQIFLSSLIGKHGQLEYMGDFIEQYDLFSLVPSDCEAGKDIYYEDKVWKSILKKYVLPNIIEEVEYKEYEPPSSGNLIRITLVDGFDLGLWGENVEDRNKVFSQEYIEVNDQDIVNEMITIANSYGDINLPSKYILV